MKCGFGISTFDKVVKGVASGHASKPDGSYPGKVYGGVVKGESVVFYVDWIDFLGRPTTSKFAGTFTADMKTIDGTYTDPRNNCHFTMNRR